MISIPNTKTQTKKSAKLLSSASKRSSVRKKIVYPLLMTSLAWLAWISLFPSDLKEKEGFFSSSDDEISGEMIVFVSDRDGKDEIYIMNSDGSDQQRLTNNNCYDSHPKFSPDGKQITFLSDRNGPYEIFIMNSDGANVRQITRSIPGVHFPSFSSDGSKLIFNCIQEGKRILMILSLTDGKKTRYLSTRHNVYHPAWSPLGDKIAFDMVEDENQDIYVANTNGGGFMRLTENAKDDFYPAWSPDGKQIAYIAGRNRNLDICVMKADGSDKRYLTSHQALDEFPSWGPDGKHIVFESRRTGKKQVFIVGSDGTGLRQITEGDYNNSSPDWCKVSYSETALTADNQKKTSFAVLKGPYLGQKPSGKKAELFAPELINYEVHGSPFISQDEKEIIIGSMTEGPKYYRMIAGVWSLQSVLPFAIPENCNGMFVSPSGKRIYFLIWEDNDENFYFIEKKGNRWTTLRSLGEEVNSFPTHWQFTTAKNENLYFSSEGNVVVSVFNGNTHLPPVPLKLESNENLEGGTPYIAPDESYLIYSIGRNERDEYTDLYISYRLKNNKWTEPINIGPSINIKDNFDLCPKISPHGKYLFFISRRNSPEFRIYWVDAGFIETLKPDELK